MPADSIVAAFWATTDPQIRETRQTDRNGVYPEIRFDMLGAFSFIIIPISTGRRTTRAVDVKRDMAETFMVEPHITQQRKGVSTDARRVEAAVMQTDSGTFALAMRETRLEAVPPGEHPTRVRPRNRCGERPNDREAIKAESGMKVNWQSTPRRMGRGEERVRLKSAGVRERPIDTMISERDKVITAGYLENQVRKPGLASPRIDEPRTKNGKSDVRVSRIAGVEGTSWGAP